MLLKSAPYQRRYGLQIKTHTNAGGDARVIKRKEKKMAENINETNDNIITEPNAPAQTEPSVEERLAQLMAENKRLKRASDKATSEAADYKKQLMASKSDSERAAMEKAERDAKMMEELEALRKESAINKFAKNYIGLGYPEKQAMQAAEAQFMGDYEALNILQKQHQEEIEKRIKADLMKSMPSPSVGNDDSITVTQDQFDKMTYQEQLKLFREHPTVYAKLAN